MNWRFNIVFVAVSALWLTVTLLLPQKAHAQQGGGVVMLAEVVDGDTIPIRYLPYFNVVAERTFVDPAELRRWKRLKYNVKKVYPYAKLAAQLLEKYQDSISAEQSERKRKKYYRMIEDELKAEFKDDIENMNGIQGEILIKLIDRETGATSYEIVREFRGSFTAFFWQGVSKMFGQDLKSNYDPKGADKDIESVVQMIEAGLL